jgi:hypothetical protein
MGIPTARRRTFFALLALLLAMPIAAQQTQPAQNCCSLLYSTGRWLGWSASYLEYTRNRQAPAPEDTIVLRSLEAAGQNVAAANAACPQSDLPVWPGWREKRLWLQGHVDELQRPTDSVKSHAYRRQLAGSAISDAYGIWAEELSHQRFAENVLRRPTCETYYFQLGFDLAYVTQAYRQADAAYRAGDTQSALQQLNQTRLRLAKAAAVLDAYAAVGSCADIGMEQLRRTIDLLANSPPLFDSYPSELRIAMGISDRIGQLLLTNCAIREEQVPPVWQDAFGPIPRPGDLQQNCCTFLFSTGRWLGWSASFLEYTRDREAPAAADRVVLQGLAFAGQNAEGANETCLQTLQAWPAWREKQLWLEGQIAELRRPTDPIKSHSQRRQHAASQIATTYELWGGELGIARINGRVVRQPNCDTYYFQLGFDLAYATQAYRQADEALNAGDDRAALHQLNQSRLRLAKALEVLRGYGEVQTRLELPLTCANIGLAGLLQSIETLAGRPPSVNTYRDELRLVSGISDRLGELLLANCTLQTPRQQQVADDRPRDAGELEGDWSFHLIGWRSRTDPEWERRWLPKARGEQNTALVIRFERRSDGRYVGTVLRQPGPNADVSTAFDLWWHGRSHAFRPGMELIWLTKSGTNRYDGENLSLNIPDSTSFHRVTSTIFVFGDAGRIHSPAVARDPRQERADSTGGLLMLRFGPQASGASAGIEP